MSDKDDTNSMIEDCMRREEFLSDWERNFIDSVQRMSFPTSRQREVLEKIWDRVTSEHPGRRR